MNTQKDKCETFKNLHHTGKAFIVPNPWDVGSAKILQGLGFKALATTSVGMAYTCGLADGAVALERVLQHCADLAASVQIPVTVDFENGFAEVPESVVDNIHRLVGTGVAGCSIEDFDSKTNRLYDFNLAVERVQAAAEFIATLDLPFQLTARAENLLRGVDGLDDTIKRLKAFEAAGANVLYAPAIKSLAQLKLVTAEITAPFNVLAPFIKGATVAALQDSGATRISVGGALTWHTINPLIRAGQEMLTEGTFNWTSDMTSKKAVMDLFG